MLLTACLLCWGCSNAPAWPDEGVADAQWVESALAWRLNTGLDACGETAKAIDALTLEWIAQSPEMLVRISTQEWPVLLHYPELKTPLIQALAWGQLHGVEWKKEALERVLRKVARKSTALKVRRVKAYLTGTPPQTL